MAKRTVQAGPRVLTGSVAPEIVPGNPTDLSGVAEQVNGRIRARIKFKPPAVPNGFAGVHGYLAAPAEVATTFSQQIGSLTIGDSAVNKPQLDMGKFEYRVGDLDASGFVTISFPVQEPPIVEQDWRAYLCPYSATYDEPLIAVTAAAGPDPATPSPNCVFTVQALQAFGLGEEFAPRVRDLDVTLLGPDWDGNKWLYKVKATWNDPTPESAPDRWQDFNAVEIDIHGSRHRVGKGVQQFTTDYLLVPVTPQKSKVRAFSQNHSGDTNTYAEGVTPEVPFTTPVYPSIGDVRNFSVPDPGYGYNPITGAISLVIRPNFDLPLDVRNFHYIQVRAHIVGTEDWVTLNHPGASAAVDEESVIYVEKKFFPTEAQVWDLHAVSVGRDGVVKWPNLKEPGTSPMVTVNIPSPYGSTGTDYCDNPTSVECEIVYPEIDEDGDGIENYGFRFRFTAPDDPRFAGCTPVAVPQDDLTHHIPLGHPGKSLEPDGWQYTSTWSIHHETLFTVWFPGRTANGLTNGNDVLVDPIPKVEGLQVLRQTTGTLNPTRFNPGKVDGNVFFTDEGKFSVKVADDLNIGITEDGITLNGVDMGLAREGTYDPAVFAADDGVFQQIAVRLGSLVAGSFDPQLFATPGGTFKLRYGGQFTQTASGLEVAQLDAGIVNTGILRVGTSTLGALSYLGVYHYTGSTNELIGWVGANGGVKGGWFKELYIGGTSPANAKIYVDSAGNATFSGTVTASVIQASTLVANNVQVGAVNNTAATSVAVYRWTGVNELVAWFGSNGSIYGGWAKEFYIGGTSPANAKIYCDASGNAFFTGSLLASQIVSGGTLAGVKLYLNLSGVTTTVDNIPSLISPGGVAMAMKISNNATGRASFLMDGNIGCLFAGGIIPAVQMYAGTGSPNPGGVFYVNNPSGVTTISMLGLSGRIDAKFLSVNGVDVVGPQITGWGMPSGTLTRSTFNTGSVTLAQLAERVYALINDLSTHGLIEAF